MTLRIRDALPSDASSLAAISMEVWIGTYLRRGVNAFFADYALSEFTSQRFEAILGSVNDHLVVSENEDGIDGFIRVSFKSPRLPQARHRLRSRRFMSSRCTMARA